MARRKLDQLAFSLTDHTVDLLRVSEGMMHRIRTLLGLLEQDIASRLQSATITSAKAFNLNVLLGDVRGLIAGTYNEMRALTQAQLAELVRTEALVVAKLANVTIGVDIMGGALSPDGIRRVVDDLLVQGAPLAEYWNKQATDLSFKFAQQMRLGIVAGETIGGLVARAKAMMHAPRSHVESLVRTTAMTAANNGRMAMYKSNSDIVEGVQQLSTLDLRTTVECAVYDHKMWDLEGNGIRGTDDKEYPFNGGPPRHWNCRSTLIMLFRDGSMPAHTRASMSGQVSSDMDFETWLASRSESQQNKVLGKGKAELWREGRISFSDLIDQRGHPLTLAELRERHGV